MYIAPLITSRLAVVQLHELSLLDSVAVGGIPAQREQEAVTAFLRGATTNTAMTSPLPVESWTVQERLHAVTHYLAHTLSDAPDFSVGDGAARLSDYLDTSKDAVPESVELGELAEDKWRLWHLTGHAAMAIERTQGAVLSGRRHWVLGAMAAQLRREGEEFPAMFTDDALMERMNILARFPEGEFIKLLAMFHAGQEQLTHFFKIGFDDSGICCLPQAEREGAELPNARFHPRNGLSPFALGD